MVKTKPHEHVAIIVRAAFKTGLTEADVIADRYCVPEDEVMEVLWRIAHEQKSLEEKLKRREEKRARQAAYAEKVAEQKANKERKQRERRERLRLEEPPTHPDAH